MSLRRIDLNLFRVFEAVMEHRTIAGAGRELNVTASAVSHALSRLRQALSDDLFVPGKDGMEPTQRARELAPAIRDGLSRIEAAIGEEPFVPAESVRTFRIATSDYGAVTILAPMVSSVANAAPQIELKVFPVGRMDAVRRLDEGRIDVLIGWFEGLPEHIRRTTIFVEKEAIVVRPGHPLTQGPITTARLFSYPYVVVELTGTEDLSTEGFLDDRGVWRRVWIDRLLIETSAENAGHVAHVAVSVPHYAAVPYMLRTTDMVATLPLSLARDAERQGSLVIVDLPYEPLSVPVEAIWHQRNDADPGLRWLVGELIAAAPQP